MDRVVVLRKLPERRTIKQIILLYLKYGKINYGYFNFQSITQEGKD